MFLPSWNKRKVLFLSVCISVMKKKIISSISTFKSHNKCTKIVWNIARAVKMWSTLYEFYMPKDFTCIQDLKIVTLVRESLLLLSFGILGSGKCNFMRKNHNRIQIFHFVLFWWQILNIKSTLHQNTRYSSIVKSIIHYTGV